MKPLTDRQIAALLYLAAENDRGHSPNAGQVGIAITRALEPGDGPLKLKGRRPDAAGRNTLYSLQDRKLVDMFRSGISLQGHDCWFITDAGKAAIA